MSGTQSKNEQWCEELAEAIKPFVRMGRHLKEDDMEYFTILIQRSPGLSIQAKHFIRLADVVDGRDKS